MPKEDLKRENIIWLVYGNKDFKPCCGKVINITEKQLEQLPNKKDTWFSELGKGCIDTIFYSKGIRLNKYETINVNGVSDHDAVFAEFDI